MMTLEYVSADNKNGLLYFIQDAPVREGGTGNRLSPYFEKRTFALDWAMRNCPAGTVEEK